MFEKSAMTQKLYDILRATNQDISYEALALAAGKPISAIRSALDSARRSLEKDKIVFSTVRGVGLRRLTDGEKVQSTEAIKASIRRTSKRGLKRLNSVSEFQRLSNADQLTATINKTMFEAIRSHTSRAKSASPAAPLPLPDISKLTTANAEGSAG